MNSDNNLDYYERRAEQALDLAARATSSAIQKIHLDMAARYAALGEAPAERSTLSIVGARN